MKLDEMIQQNKDMKLKMEIEKLIKEKVEKHYFRRDLVEKFIGIERQKNSKFKIEDADKIIGEFKAKMNYMKDFNVCSEKINQFYIDFISNVFIFIHSNEWFEINS